MVTERRIIIEKQNWVPVMFDDGSSIALAIVLLIGLGLIGYAMFIMPQDNRTVVVPATESTASAPAPAATPATTDTTTNNNTTNTQ